MSLKQISTIFISTLLLLCSYASIGQNRDNPQITTRILFLLDASGSMAGTWQHNTKMNIAKKLLTEIADSLNNKENVEIALRMYGHQSSRVDKDCKDTKLEVPFGKTSALAIKEKLKTVIPKGSTPIAYSLEKAAGDFPSDPFSRNYIVLITDGKEGCDGDPCAVSLALQRQHVILKPFVIGLGLDVSIKDAFDCVGTYYDAAREESFKEVLNVVIAQALSNTTVQLDLNNEAGKPTGTNVPVTFFDATMGIERYNFIHTLNTSGKPDTMLIDPSSLYDIIIHSNPEVQLKGVKITPGKHNVIKAHAPLGNLRLSVDGISGYRNLKASVSVAGRSKVISRQEFNSTQFYLAGKYNLEVNTLPILEFKDVVIKSGEEYKIYIPQPGKVSFSTPSNGYGAIFLIKEKGIEKIHDINPEDSKNPIVMQPGTYKVVFRSARSSNTILSVDKEFTVMSGQFVTVKLTR